MHIRSMQAREARRKRRRRLIWLVIIILLLAWWLWPRHKEAKQSANDTNASDNLSADAFTVFVSPGNGGDESGPTYPDGDANPTIQAKDINLAIGQAISRALAKEGVRVVLSRTDDSFIDAIDRKELAEQNKASLSLAIYVNANYSNTALAGWQIVDYKKVDWPDNYKQRQALAHELDESLNNRLLAYGIVSGGVFTRNSAFVPDMPTVVLLVGYLSNDIERGRLTTESYQWDIANAVTDAVVVYRDTLAEKTDEPTDIPPEQSTADLRLPF